MLEQGLPYSGILFYTPLAAASTQSLVPTSTDSCLLGAACVTIASSSASSESSEAGVSSTRQGNTTK